MSEQSYGAVIGKSKTFLSRVESFPGYLPVAGENSAAELGDAIHGIEIIEEDVIDLVNDFKQEVFERNQVFSKGEQSIRLTLSPILSYVAGKYGKNSNQHIVVRHWIGKLRGQRVIPIGSNPDAATHSVSQMGFNSIVANYNSLIGTCRGFGASYDPANQKITVANMTLLAEEAHARNEAVDSAYNLMAPKVAERAAAFAALSVLCQCMKNLIKSQYGIKSIQYKMVKGIAI